MIHRVVALLPIKKESERIPNKNFREFKGKPLFMWVLETLLSIEQIDRVVINTDCVEVMSSYGISSHPKIHLRGRKPELVGNFISMNEIIRDDISEVSSRIYLMTHATNPLLTEHTVRNAVEVLEKSLESNKNDSLFSVNRVRARFYDSEVRPINHDPDSLLPTQHLDTWFEENSNLYLFTPDGFRSSGARIGTKPIMFETPKLESVDIDEPEDWALAEDFFECLKRRKELRSES